MNSRDRKTVKLGYTARDLAEFLQRQGYSVLVSQWDPVVEYGTQHTWSRFTRFRQTSQPTTTGI